jgi:hypothetical protein
MKVVRLMPCRLGKVVKLLAFIREVRISNPGRETCYPEIFRGFLVSRK